MAELMPRLTSKGQVTIPAAIRERLGLKPRDRVRFEIVDDQVVLRPARLSVRDTYGMVKPHNRPENWAAIREEVERAIAEEVMSETE